MMELWTNPKVTNDNYFGARRNKVFIVSPGGKK